MKIEKIGLAELESKRVVSVKNGENLGRIRDLEIDVGNGTVLSVTVGRRRGFLGLFGGEERNVSWKDICLVGEDTVLVSTAAEAAEVFAAGKKKSFGLFE